MHGVYDQASLKRPHRRENSSSDPHKKQRYSSSVLEVASVKTVKGIVNHRGDSADNATEYKVRFTKPYQDKSLDEWWPACKLDVQQIGVYVARKARKADK